MQEFLKSKQGKKLHFKLFKKRCSLMPQYNEFDFISNIREFYSPYYVRLGITYHAVRQEKKYKITWETWWEKDDGTRYNICTVEKFMTHNVMYKALFKREFEIVNKEN